MRLAILARLEEIAANPFANHPNVKPLVGEAGLFRLRHGDWRILYRVVRVAEEIRVEVIETREGVYK